MQPQWRQLDTILLSSMWLRWNPKDTLSTTLIGTSVPGMRQLPVVLYNWVQCEQTEFEWPKKYPPRSQDVAGSQSGKTITNSAAAFSPSTPNISDAEQQELRHQRTTLSFPFPPLDLHSPILKLHRPLASRGRIPLIS